MTHPTFGPGRVAKPRIRIDALLFWFVVLTSLPALGYHYGFEEGFEKGRSTPAKCPDHSADGKRLSNVAYAEGSKQTTCTYIRGVYGRGKWVQKS